MKPRLMTDALNSAKKISHYIDTNLMSDLSISLLLWKDKINTDINVSVYDNDNNSIHLDQMPPIC